MNSYEGLPSDLPVPEDDGAAADLPGETIPHLLLQATDGSTLDLGALGVGRTVLYVYPMTGKPGIALPDGWDEIPGARGCTPEACGFRDHFGELRDAGAERVFGLSSQDSAYQAELAERIALPFPLLSDSQLRLADLLRLPTFQVDGRRLYKRLTMLICDQHVERVFYPVFPPDTHAAEVLAWLRSQQR